jgi:hypothetical protein
MSEPSLKPDLFEKGTRWEHYTELRDLFASGVEILKTLKVKSRADQEKQSKLQHAVEMIEGRLNYITDYTQKTSWGSNLRMTVDGDVDDMFRKMKRENTDGKPQDQTNDDGESPASYTTK